MNYPLISEYVEAIRSAEDNFNELSYLRPVLGDDGQPVMTSGNFAVVFKMKDKQRGKLYAVKCFTREQEGRAEAYREIAKELKDVSSPYLVSFRYLEKELFVDTDQTTKTEFPVLLMDWVEGKTLDMYLRENLDNKCGLEMLANRFSLLAQWLILQPFAHGDLKPDNIIVCKDGTFVLVDYDGMYVPAMKGQKARELGSPDFRHPLRTADDFDEHIDDFSLFLIYLSLRAVSVEPNLLIKYGTSNSLLFTESNFNNIYLFEPYQVLILSQESIIKNDLLGITTLILDKPVLVEITNRLFDINPVPSRSINVVSLFSESDIKYKKTDDKGVVYNSSDTILIKATRNLDNYTIGYGTIVICESAFSFNSLSKVHIPNSITHIGNYVFGGCEKLRSISIPMSVKFIGENILYGCHMLESINVEKGNTIYDSRNDCNAIIETASNTLIAGCKNSVIPNNIKTIGEHAFNNCLRLKSISIPNSVIRIGEYAFTDCQELINISIPNSVEVIGDSAFAGCSSLKVIEIPNSIKEIGENAFSACQNLEKVIIPETVSMIKYGTFSDCAQINSLNIPNSIKYIGPFAFAHCTSLKTINIPSSAQYISSCAFRDCDNLSRISIPFGTKKIFELIFPDMKEILFEDKPMDFSSIKHYKEEILSTEVSKEDIENTWTDEFGVKYSADGLKLLNACSYKGGNVYTVKEGTKLLCSNAFTDSESGKFPSVLILPHSLISIGKDAFESFFSPNVSELLVPNGQTERFKAMTSQYQHMIYDYTLSTICTDKDLSNGVLDEFGVVYSRDGSRLLKCLYRGDIIEYVVRKGTKVICDGAFCGELAGVHEWKSNLKSVILPDSILRIGDAFNACGKLKYINIPNSVISLNGFWFSGIEKIIIPASVKIIKDYTFGPTCHLKEIIIKGRPIIRPNAFFTVPGLEAIYIPKGTRDYFKEQIPKFSKILIEL